MDHHQTGALETRANGGALAEASPRPAQNFLSGLMMKSRVESPYLSRCKFVSLC
jgi:hypothetical protein